jgi:GNAT superfamily N-acetyltransferase
MFDQLQYELPDVKVVKPKGLSPRMFFKVYSGVNTIGFAQLSSSGENNHQLSTYSDGKAPGVSFCLKNIEVSQNYRNQGVGSALLDEVIRFCRDEQVTSLYGEAKGDVPVLRRWYEGKGFDLDGVDNIQLSF